MTNEEAQKVLNIICRADEGNEVVILEMMNWFIAEFPEWAELTHSRWKQETGKQFKKR